MLRFEFRSTVVTKMRRLIPLLAAAAFFLTTTAAQADLGDQLFKLLPNDGAFEHHFGNSVAIDGETVVVGAPWDDYNGEWTGSAYLFDTATGAQIAKFLPDDGAQGDLFGNSVGVSGNTAIVGAHQNDIYGSAYLFDTSTGQQLAKLLPDDGAALLFGFSVAISGAIAIVGAYGDDTAYLFDTTTGQQVAKLLPDDGTAGDSFGYSVAINGATAVVGAYLDGDNGLDSGSAYLFDTTTGKQLAKLLPSDGAAGDWFGYSVAISGSTVVVGAVNDDDNGFDAGSAYVFDTTTGQQIAKLLTDDGAVLDHVGESVAISGTTAIVGVIRNDENGNFSGASYLFDATTGQQVAKLLPDDGMEYAYFGSSVAISGTTAIVGAIHDDENDPGSGSAYLFDAAGGAVCSWDIDGDDNVGASDLAILLGAWGPYPGHPADLDGDGEVGPFDLALLLGNWGPCE